MKIKEIVKVEGFLIVGEVNGEEEAFEIESIAEISFVGARMGYLGRELKEEEKRKEEFLRLKIQKEKESFEEIDLFLDDIEIKQKSIKNFGDVNLKNNKEKNKHFFKNLISDFLKAVKLT